MRRIGCTAVALVMHLILWATLPYATGDTTARDSLPDSNHGPRLEQEDVGLGFLIGRRTERLLHLLKQRGDFLEMVAGPGKVGYIRKLPPGVKAMCVAQNLEDVARTVRVFREEGIDPKRVLMAYNPEQRPPSARECTPREELEDPVGSLRRAREILEAYPAPLIMGPGLHRMAAREHLYPVLAGLCDGWMIQSQRLEVDVRTWTAVSPDRYRAEVRRIVAMLREGNPDIRIFVQIVPFTRTPELKAAFTGERLAAYIRSIDGMVDGVKIYGGDTVLIEEVFQLLREGKRRPESADEPRRPTPEPGPRAAKPAPSLPSTDVAPEIVPAAGEKRTVMIPMRDGVRLATDLYFPTDYSPDAYTDGVPVVLVCTPYDRTREGPMGRWKACFLNSGYVFAVQDMRGFYGSANTGRGRPRHYDGYDTTEWFAGQWWCNGKIGMLGYSHLGAVQYETAATDPPHLACAIPAQAPGNYYTNSLYPPVFRKADTETIWRRPFTRGSRQLINRRIRGRNHIPLERFNTPMLHSAGWYDFYTEGAVEMFRACQHHGGPNARGNQKLLIGPWGHGVLQEQDPDSPLTLPGGLAYPVNSKLDWERDVWLPWFDRWLKAMQTGVMEEPAVRYYLMGDVDDPEAPGNQWIETDDFPPACEHAPYYIHADHTLSTEKPLSRDSSMEFRYDPSDPVPTVGRVHPRVPVKGLSTRGRSRIGRMCWCSAHLCWRSLST